MTRSARVRRVGELPAALDELGIRRGRPVLVLVGGAGGMSEEDLELADGMLRAAVFPVLERCDAVVVDGGTDSGVMGVAGRARAGSRGRFPLIGVAAEGTVVGPDTADLEPNHTHIVLVPGQSWGDESPWLADVAAAIAGGRPSVTLVINGGAITYDDIDFSLGSGRPVLVAGGSGRTADAVAAVANPRARRVAASDLTQVVDITDPTAISTALEAVLID